LATKIYQTNVQGVNDPTQRLTDTWAGMEPSIIDNFIYHWCRRLHACLRATAWHKLVKTFKLSINLLLNKTFLSDYH